MKLCIEVVIHESPWIIDGCSMLNETSLKIKQLRVGIFMVSRGRYYCAIHINRRVQWYIMTEIGVQNNDKIETMLNDRSTSAKWGEKKGKRERRRVNRRWGQHGVVFLVQFLSRNLLGDCGGVLHLLAVPGSALCRVVPSPTGIYPITTTATMTTNNHWRIGGRARVVVQRRFSFNCSTAGSRPPHEGRGVVDDCVIVRSTVRAYATWCLRVSLTGNTPRHTYHGGIVRITEPTSLGRLNSRVRDATIRPTAGSRQGWLLRVLASATRYLLEWNTILYVISYNVAQLTIVF